MNERISFVIFRDVILLCDLLGKIATETFKMSFTLCELAFSGYCKFESHSKVKAFQLLINCQTAVAYIELIVNSVLAPACASNALHPFESLHTPQKAVHGNL